MDATGPTRVERKLVAILAADVVGYSRLMGADEEDTFARLKAHRRELIDPQVVEHHGRVVKLTGDGLLIEFPSVVEAVRCAVKIQQVIADRNAQIAPEKRIEFRIGINLGDVIVEDGDIYGDGVNIAARLEATAVPGGICISARVLDEIRTKVDLEYEDLGERQLKNIAHPVRAYHVRNRDAAIATVPPLGAQPLALPSEPLGPFVQIDEALVGGKGGPHKELVLVAAETNGRVRLAHAENNDAATCKRFADGQIAADARVVTDGHAGYSQRSLGKRPHDAIVQTKAQRRESDAVQSCHWTISLLKRWLLGTHAGAVRHKHLQAYLDEFAFRHNRRKTNSSGTDRGPRDREPRRPTAVDDEP